MKRKINSLTVVNGQSTREFIVGFTAVQNKRVAEIRDLSTEYEDHVFVGYTVRDESGNLLAEIINCPVVVEYEA
ncbi:hypothetical protein [Brevibacillus centrosporus]|uniref:hypothetical protein n=1 Tax=Brevibacillus centrosporus TaxID=54910 RepID=UPI002E1F0BBB|nr:hypothetical protein [Brevibacillus centrosporus]